MSFADQHVQPSRPAAPRRRLSRLLFVALAAGLIAVVGAGALTAARSTKWWWDNLAGPDSSNFVDSDQIKKSNVNQLDVAWSYPYATAGFNPVVVEDVMYLAGRNGSPHRPRRDDRQGDLDPRGPRGPRVAGSTTGRARTARTSACCSASTASSRPSTHGRASRS